MLTKDSVSEMGRLNLRRKAMEAGMERDVSRKAKDEQLREFIFENHPDLATNGKAKKPAPPKPLSDEEKAAKDAGDAPVKKRGRPKKKKEEPKKVEAEAPVADNSDLADMVNRLDVIGVAVAEMQEAIKEMCLGVKHNCERLVDMESQIGAVHRASYHIYTATVDAIDSYDDIEEVPHGGEDD